MKIHQILGPPGTGKTTTLSDIIDAMDDPSGVIALSFTRAAKWALLRKCRGLMKQQVRTIHSMAYESVGLTKDNMLHDGQVAAFFNSRGLSYNAHTAETDQSLPGNKIEGIISKAIHVSPRYAGDDPWVRVEAAIVDTYDPLASGLFMAKSTILKTARDYWAHQEKLDRYDFNGVLLLALDHGLRIEGTDLIMDEAQDLTPIMVDLLRPCWDRFNNVYIVGDDDQAIFNFAGADPEFMLTLKADHVSVLHKSWRLPSKIHAMSQAFIETNKNRIAKEFIPKKSEGRILSVSSIAEAIDKADQAHPILIVTRVRHRVRQIGAELKRAGILYRELGDTPEQPAQSVRRCLDCMHSIRAARDEVITHGEWTTLLRQVPREALKGLPPKTEIARWVSMPCSIDHLSTLPGASDVIARLATMPMSSLLNWRQLSRWAQVWKGRTEEPNTRVRLGTIHQSKGLDAYTVIVDTTMSAKIRARIDEEDEKRVWYVAITRAKNTLMLVGANHKALTLLAKKHS